MTVSAPAAPQSREWERMSCVLDDGPAAVAAIGLITLSNDTVIEAELRKFLAIDGVGLYASRVALPKEITPDNLRDMEKDLPHAARLIVPDDTLSVMAFGCTSGTMAIGAERVARAITTVRPGIPVTDPISASLKGLEAVGARRVALLTPYPDSVNNVVASYFTEQGLEIVEQGSFKQLGDPTICRVPPDAIYRAGVALGSCDVEALFISCTALRCSSVIQRIEQEIGKPVIASNQALAWDCLRLSGYREPFHGFGRLLTL